jgi:tripartite-type tricarboxylate transporter receptor subunit TctC
MAPAGTPKEIVDKLNTEINAILKTEDMRARMAKMAAVAGSGNAEEFRKFVLAEIDRYGEIVRLSGAQKID